IRVPLGWQSKGGLVLCVFFFGGPIGGFLRPLIGPIFGEGGLGRTVEDTDWIGYGAKLLSGEEPMANYERNKEVIAAFLMTRTKADLFEIARANNLLIAPIATIEDVRQNPQFIAREYWQTVAHPGGASLTYPGPFARFSGKPITYR